MYTLDFFFHLLRLYSTSAEGLHSLFKVVTESVFEKVEKGEKNP